MKRQKPKNIFHLRQGPFTFFLADGLFTTNIVGSICLQFSLPPSSQLSPSGFPHPFINTAKPSIFLRNTKPYCNLLHTTLHEIWVLEYCSLGSHTWIWVIWAEFALRLHSLSVTHEMLNKLEVLYIQHAIDCQWDNDSEPRGAAQTGVIKKLRDHFTFQMYSMIAGGNSISLGLSIFLSSSLPSMQLWAEAPRKCC